MSMLTDTTEKIVSAIEKVEECEGLVTETHDFLQEMIAELADRIGSGASLTERTVATEHLSEQVLVSLASVKSEVETLRDHLSDLAE